jgi:hypothetical protein
MAAVAAASRVAAVHRASPVRVAGWARGELLPLRPRRLPLL